MRKSRAIFMGSSRDTIYQNGSPSADWWNDKRKGWRIFRWSLALLAVLLVLGLIVYFLMIDMQVMAPVLTRSKDAQTGKMRETQWTTDTPGMAIDDAVSLDGDVVLDLGGVTYHEGRYHITTGQSVNPEGTADNNNGTAHQDYIEIIPAPNLGTSTSIEFSSKDQEPSLPTTTIKNDMSSNDNSLKSSGITKSSREESREDDGDSEILYATSRLFNMMKATTQQLELSTENQSLIKGSLDDGLETATTTNLIRQQNVSSGKGGIKVPTGGAYKITAPGYAPVFPTLPTTTNAHREVVDTSQRNDSEIQCFSPRLEICRGILPYDLTALPLVPGVTKLSELDSAMPYFEMILDSGCSPRAQQFICSLLEPECRPESAGLLPPCRRSCKVVAEDCSDFILATLDLARVFHCDLYPDTDDSMVCINLAKGSSCLEQEFRCSDGSCIPNRWVCDGVQDCAHSTDEFNCSHCGPEEFRCEVGRECIPQRWRCDGQQDCQDGSDEGGCRQDNCEPGQFACADSSACISTRYICDGTKQCRDNSDERNCSETECRVDDFKCHQSGRCIPLLWQCNGVSDCSDSSDEDNCREYKTN